VTQFLNHFHGPVIYLVVVAFLVGESGLGVGFFVPGEIAVVLGGVLAREGRVNVWVMAAVAAIGAIGSYCIGYGVGRLILPRLLERRPLRGNPGVMRTQQLLTRWGGPAVLFARFIAVVRAFMPALVGGSDVPFRTFMIFNVIGGVIWAVGYTALGYALGTAYHRILSDIGVWSYVVIGVVVVGLVAYHFWSSRRHRRTMAAQQADGVSEEEPESSA
jgi:membrane-associated protein